MYSELSASTSVSSSPTDESVSTTSVKPFVSVENGGSITTITPSGTSLVSFPTGLVNSTVGLNSSLPSLSACSASNYALNGAAAPFCLPTNGTMWIKNTSYPITWDPNFWPGYNGTIVLALLYAGKDGSNVISQVNSLFQLMLIGRTVILQINEASSILILMMIGLMEMM
jgi:Ykl077w/Psg1 (Pma1 Stabilization in Golgi)